MTEISKVNIRKEAALSLQEILDEGGYSSIVLQQHLRAWPETEERDRRLYTSLVYTTLDHLPTVEAGLAAWSSVPLRKMKPWIRNCLRLGLAQLLYMDKIPASAAVHETVELVKQSPYRGLAGFVNGVLRGALRAGLQVPQPDPVRQPLEAMSLRYDMPIWIVRLWQQAYGTETAEMLLRRSQGEKPLCCRVNTIKNEPDKLYEQLTEMLGPERVRRSEILPEALYLQYSGDITQWAPYRDGLLSIQDESSMLAATAAGARPGDRVLDLCAAPGGKSVVMAQQMRDRGEIRSLDLHPHRVALIQKNVERLGLHCIHPAATDGTAPESVEEAAYDVVLVDAPCSGLGILRSKPDIKYHRAPQEQAELTALQGQLLRNAARGVKAGGRLAYSTCTINPDENEKQVEAFLAENPTFELVDLEKELPILPECDRLLKKYLLLYPQPKGRDGFFVAVMKRVK